MRRITLIWTLTLAACGSGSTKLSTSSADTAGETDGGADGGTADGDGGSDGAADGAADGADGADGGDGTEPPPPAPDFARFSGQRTFSVDAYGDTWDCDGDAIAEEGTAISEGSTYREAADLCPSCELIYEVRPSAESACEGWVPLSNPSIRMLDLDEGAAKVYSMSESRGEFSLVVLDEDADFDGFNLSYAYSADWSYGSTLSVTGELSFPELARD
jgi:hypothetical protein